MFFTVLFIVLFSVGILFQARWLALAGFVGIMMMGIAR